jgi:serine/threonine-protein kinase
MTSTTDPLVGQVLDRRYHVIDRVARGGMATVYRATDTRLDRLVALKVMHVGLGDDADFTRKFDREARAAAKLSHPNVVSVFDQGNDGGRPYIVMELVEGKTLRTVISRESPLAPVRALSMIEPVLSALASAHDAGLVHRDIKPENVLISERGQIKVGDFGLARAVTAQTSTATAGLLIGTVSYLPPELVLSGRADARSDVYSTGVVLFEMLTGRKPHTGETPIQVAYAHVHNDVPPPSSLPTAGPIPDYLDALIARATARTAEARPHDARVMLAQVRRVKGALQAGLDTDPELTEDLTIPLRALRSGDALDDAAGEAIDPFSVTTAIAPTLAVAAAEERAEISRTSPPEPLVADPYDPEVTEEREYTPTDIRFLSGPSTPSQLSPSRLNEDSVPLPTRAPRPNRPVHASRRRWRGWVALIIVLLLTVMASAAGWYFVKGRFTTAPALTSLTEQRASSIARESGLTVDFTQSYSETVPKGVVIDTRPRPGGQILRGGEIDAVVSKGPERYPMPKVTGLSESAAEELLGRGNLAVGQVEHAYSETVQKELVISASEQPGASLKRDTEIDLVISDGRRPIKITDYTGQDADRAAAELKDAGFDVAVGQEHSASVPEGEVIKQSPENGTGHLDDKIKLVESLGPVMVTVPNTKSMGVEAAKDVLRDKGFKVRTANSSILHLGLGYVESSDPPGGSKVAEGSTITLYLV